jgi:hypothetical protein
MFAHIQSNRAVFWQLPARLPADDERHQQPADAVPLGLEAFEIVLQILEG